MSVLGLWGFDAAVAVTPCLKTCLILPANLPLAVWPQEEKWAREAAQKAAEEAEAAEFRKSIHFEVCPNSWYRGCLVEPAAYLYSKPGKWLLPVG